MRRKAKIEKMLSASKFDSRVRTVMNRLFEEENGLWPELKAEVREEPRWDVFVGHKDVSMGFSSQSIDVVFCALSDVERDTSAQGQGTIGTEYRVLCRGDLPIPVRIVMEHAVLVAIDDLSLDVAVARLSDNQSFPVLGREGLTQLVRP